jgi:hypothetical protein
MDWVIKNTEQGVWYAPDIGDNRERPVERQMRCLIVPMSGGDMQRIEDQGLRLTRGGKLNLSRMHKVRVAIVSRCVQEITGLRVRDERKGGEVVDIHNGQELAELAGYGPADALTTELFEVIKDHSLLEEGLEKK